MSEALLISGAFEANDELAAWRDGMGRFWSNWFSSSPGRAGCPEGVPGRLVYSGRVVVLFECYFTKEVEVPVPENVGEFRSRFIFPI